MLVRSSVSTIRQSACPRNHLVHYKKVASGNLRSVPSITAYHGAFQTANEICIVMEYCPRGDLLEHLLAEGRAFSEARVAQVAATLLATLQVRLEGLGRFGASSNIEPPLPCGASSHVLPARIADLSISPPVPSPSDMVASKHSKTHEWRPPGASTALSR